MNTRKVKNVLAIIFALTLLTGGCGREEDTSQQPNEQSVVSQPATEKPVPAAANDQSQAATTQVQKDVAPDEVSSHRVLYQEGVDVTIVKDGKPVTERIAVYGVAGLRFPARNLVVDRRAKLTTTVIIIEAAKGAFLVPKEDSAVPVNMGFDKSAKFGLSFFTHAINTTWKFAKPGIRFYAEDSTYESERAGASISFTEDGVKMDGIKKRAGK